MVARKGIGSLDTNGFALQYNTLRSVRGPDPTTRSYSCESTGTCGKEPKQTVVLLRHPKLHKISHMPGSPCALSADADNFATPASGERTLTIGYGESY